MRLIQVKMGKVIALIEVVNGKGKIRMKSEGANSTDLSVLNTKLDATKKKVLENIDGLDGGFKNV